MVIMNNTPNNNINVINNNTSVGIKHLKTY